MIHYLEAEEKERSRELWEEAFYEDSESFLQYYFTEKTKDNEVLVLEEEGKIISMLHRNPYQIYMRGDIRRCDYIVGVATTKEERHKGHMRALLLSLFRDLYTEHMPFTFLMPAREGIYYPFDFRYVFDRPRWTLKYSPGIHRVPADPALSPELAEWQDAWMKHRYEIYAVRDENYISRMQKELESEDGSVDLIYEGDRFIGMESEWGLKEKEQRYLYIEDSLRSEVSRKPAIMARIICLPLFVKNIRLSHDCPVDEVTLDLGIGDLFIPQNHGEWSWKLTKEGSEMTLSSRFISTKKTAYISIAEMTQWLFGYRMPKAAESLPYSSYIEPYNGIFLDEEV